MKESFPQELRVQIALGLLKLCSLQNSEASSKGSGENHSQDKIAMENLVKNFFDFLEMIDKEDHQRGENSNPSERVVDKVSLTTS